MRHARRMVLTLWTVTVAATAPAAFAQNVETGVVMGHVYCADTQKPARFATIRLQPVDNELGRGAGSGFGTTGPDGSFRITGVTPGDYYAEVTMPGYVQPLRGHFGDLEQLSSAQRDRITAQLTRVSVTGNQPVTVQVTIFRGATITGSVSFDDGSPAPGVSVQAFTATPDTTTGSQAAQTGTTPRQFGGSAMTDDRGQFRVTGLGDGIFTVQATPRSVFPVYYGNTIALQSAKKLDLHSGDEVTGVDIVVPALGMHRVSGVVVAQQDGHSLARASVQLRLSSGEGVTLSATTGSDGSFTFDAVPDGKFSLQVSNAYDAATHTGYSSAAQPFEVNGTDVADMVVDATAHN